MSINVKLNDQCIEVAEDHRMLSKFLQINNIQGEYFAVAINTNLISHSEFETHRIKENDVIEIITPMQGG